MERLNAILMTAFTSALGLAPLVVEGGNISILQKHQMASRPLR